MESIPENSMTVKDFLQKNNIIDLHINYVYSHHKLVFMNLPNFRLEPYNNIVNNENGLNGTKFKCFDTRIYNCLVIHDDVLFDKYYPGVLENLMESVHYFNILMPNDFLQRIKTQTVIILHISNLPSDIIENGYSVKRNFSTIYEILCGKASVYIRDTIINNNNVISFNFDMLRMDTKLT